jgi:hypothetical protein
VGVFVAVAVGVCVGVAVGVWVGVDVGVSVGDSVGTTQTHVGSCVHCGFLQNPPSHTRLALQSEFSTQAALHPAGGVGVGEGVNDSVGVGDNVEVGDIVGVPVGVSEGVGVGEFRVMIISQLFSCSALERGSVSGFR